MHGRRVVVAVEHDGRASGSPARSTRAAQLVGLGGGQRRRPPWPGVSPSSSRRTTRSAIAAASSRSWVTSSGGRAGGAQDAGDLAGEPVVELAVEAGQRLVEQQQARRRRERAGERDALGLAAAQPGDVARAEPGEPDEVRASRRPAGRSRRRGRRCMRSPNADVGGDVAVREQLLVLEHHADAAAVRRHARDVAAVEVRPCRRRARRARRRRAAACSCRCPTGRAGRRSRRRRRPATRRAARASPP